MRAVDLLRAVRDGQSVPEAALREFVLGIGKGEIPDYQASAFTMAVCLRGLSPELTATLTLAMRDSGRVLDLSKIPGSKVDKHSTGGVGDKISLPLAPWVAACGVRVPMISGRGLGHTGGTLDKLEAIPGFRVDLTIDRFEKILAELGLCLIGQTSDLAPADKKLYALRDVTATVESVPLITASILSKKLCEDLDGLVMDVKVGRGAFMKDEASARTLAESLVRVGAHAGLKTRAVLTRMEAPLGRTIGNALEVVESLEILRGNGPADTTELTRVLASEMLLLGGAAADEAGARRLLDEALGSGRALELFGKLIAAQGGDPRVVDDPTRLPSAPEKTVVRAERRGFVSDVDSYALGMAAMRLGAGRARAEDTVDPAVGVEVLAPRGSEVVPGDALARLHHRPGQSLELDQVRDAFSLSDRAPVAAPLVLGRI